MNKYKFGPTIQVALESYKTYLKEERYAANYFRQNTNYAGIFLEWIDKAWMLYKSITKICWSLLIN